MREIPRGTASSSSAMPARFIATWYLAACDRGVASGRRDGRLSFWAEILQSRFQQAGRHAHVGAPGTRRPSFQGLADDWSACGAQFCAQFGASCGAPAPVELNQSTTNSDHVITPTTRKYTEKDKPTSPSPDRRQGTGSRRFCFARNDRQMEVCHEEVHRCPRFARGVRRSAGCPDCKCRDP